MKKYTKSLAKSLAKLILIPGLISISFTFTAAFTLEQAFDVDLSVVTSDKADEFFSKGLEAINRYLDEN